MDVDLDLVAGGSGAQSFVGAFDGHSFSADRDDEGPIAHIADHGRDFYAAISWSDLPDSHTHPVWLALMSNHQSGKYYPTHPRRGAMTIPPELVIFEAEGAWRLGQRPIPALLEKAQPISLQTADLSDGHWQQLMRLNGAKLGLSA